ncbi:HHE domain-containing protein [Lophiotrema nucula]|uniref:HHE domain-containing protein n=1 Tax=Lophiotrema nucula TaxID=690887 RepID=A0A6A5ZU94_9PLEO|nr:HHE domain-containing protein [Lophiotrema nucula]
MSFTHTFTSPALRTGLRPVLRLPLKQRSAQIGATARAASTITQKLKEDHREIESHYNEVVSTSDPEHQQRFGNQFTWELARHSHGEELLVYPAFEKYLGDKGKEMAESDRKQHHEMLKVFQNMSSSDPKYVPHLKELMTSLKEHIKDEEQSDLPALEEALAKHPGYSESMAKNFGMLKALVPSRAHPSAGENPLFEGPLGLLLAPIDHIADIMRRFPDKVISPNPSTK